MSAVLLLRVSAFTSLLFALGHTLGGVKFWSPMGDNQVLQLMRSVHFDVMGTSRSYFDFYMGFGWSLQLPASYMPFSFGKFPPSAKMRRPHARWLLPLRWQWG
jgi:hypothetical protein